MRSRTLEVLPVRNGRGLVARRNFARGACITRLQGEMVHSDALWT